MDIHKRGFKIQIRRIIITTRISDIETNFVRAISAGSWRDYNILCEASGEPRAECAELA
jgi:hypothetical protein